jgi:exodeoxyribonuclease VII small subunit
MDAKRRKGREGRAIVDERRTSVGAPAGSAGGAPGEQTPPEGPPLEQALARLEAIVRELEAGNIDLDRSLALFEEGVALSRQAAKRLGEAEAKITKLVRSLDGEFRTEPFRVEGEDGES